MIQNSEIRLVGSINEKHYYKSDNIATLLNSDQQVLGEGKDFVGRPGTRIYANNKDVVKIRAELGLAEDKALQWSENVLRKEREMSLYHPHKTWFIFGNAPGTVLVGSICPRLRPLHIELNKTPQTSSDVERNLTILQAVYSQYFHLAKTAGIKLDEGLSNFAVDKNDTVYYLDDEYYSWDNFVAFSAMLGVMVRSLPWLDLNFIRQLTDTLVRLIDEIFQDHHCRIIISTQLQSVFMPPGQKQDLLTEVIKGFSKTPISTVKEKKPQKTKVHQNNRYFAIMADIHANEAALNAVLAFYKERNINQGIVLGDIVGYGPDPLVCIKKLQESGFEIIKGNHDHAVATANTEKGYSRDATSVINWTIEQLDKEHREWLKYLPSFSHNLNWLSVHGAPIDPAFFYGYVYTMTAKDNLNYLQNNNISLCFHGHSHMPGIYARDDNKKDIHLTEQHIELSNYINMLVCPGSVGQPRNGDPNAQCAIYDKVDKAIEFFSIPYSVDSVIQRMIKHNFSDQLCQRLQTGR